MLCHKQSSANISMHDFDQNYHWSNNNIMHDLVDKHSKQLFFYRKLNVFINNYFFKNDWNWSRR